MKHFKIVSYINLPIQVNKVSQVNNEYRCWERCSNVDSDSFNEESSDVSLNLSLCLSSSVSLCLSVCLSVFHALEV